MQENFIEKEYEKIEKLENSVKVEKFNFLDFENIQSVEKNMTEKINNKIKKIDFIKNRIKKYENIFGFIFKKLSKNSFRIQFFNFEHTYIDIKLIDDKIKIINTQPFIVDFEHFTDELDSNGRIDKFLANITADLLKNK